MSLKNKKFYYDLAVNEALISGGWRTFTIKELKKILVENYILDDRDNFISSNVTGAAQGPGGVYVNDIGLNDQIRPNEEFVMYDFEEYSEYRMVNDATAPVIINALQTIIDNTYNNLLDKNVYMQIRIYGNQSDSFVYSSAYRFYNELMESVEDFVQGINEKYDDDTFIILKTSINYVKNTGAIIGHYRINEERAHEKWFIINHKTRKNCLFVCLNVGIKWKKNIKLLLEEKYRIMDTHNNFIKDNKIPTYIRDTPCELHLVELSKILKVNIYIYNATYNVYNKYIYREGLETIHIQITESHAKLLLDKKYVLKTHPNIKECDLYIIDAKNDKLTNKHKPFLKKKYEEDLDEKIITWDIETYSTNNNTYVYSISLYGGDSTKNAIFTNKILLEMIQSKKMLERDVIIGCMKLFVDYIKKNHTDFNKHTLYAHNGSKYDLIFLLKEIILYDTDIQIITKSVIESNNRFLNISIKIQDSEITFKDSYALLPYSLSSLCHSFQTVNSKIDIDIDKLKKINKIIENFDEIVSYNVYDVLSLYEILIIFAKQIFDLFKLNITKSTTIASLARNILRTDKYFSEDLYNIPDYVEDFIKKSYFGGRTECFILGHIKDKIINCYDINSSYIYSGVKALPLGKSIRIKEDSIEKVLKDPLYNQSFVKVLAKVKENVDLNNFIPVHPIKTKEGLIIFPIIKDWLEIIVYLPELKLGLFVGYEYKYIEGFYFKSSYSLKNIFNSMYGERIKYNKKNILNFVYKLIGVSIYGCFGYNVLNKSNIKISNKHSKDHIKYLKKNKLKNTSIIGNYELNEIISDIDIDRNYAIASAITSYGRIRLYEIYLDIIKKGFKIYYSDTDSVFTDLYMENYSDLVSKYNLNTNVLGGLKNEMVPSCNEGYIIGNKKYVFTNKEHNVIKTSFNGVMYNNDFDDNKYCEDFKKLSISDKNNIIKENLIIEIFNNKNIIRKQNYFISNKNLYLNDSNPFNVNWCSVNIEFNKKSDNNDSKYSYIEKYKKGYFNDDTKLSDGLYAIKPYILKNNQKKISCLYKGIDDVVGIVLYRKY